MTSQMKKANGQDHSSSASSTERGQQREPVAVVMERRRTRIAKYVAHITTQVDAMMRTGRYATRRAARKELRRGRERVGR